MKPIEPSADVKPKIERALSLARNKARLKLGSKSQGSEYPAFVIPVPTQHYPMLQRNLLYTAVTRGKRLVVLVQ